MLLGLLDVAGSMGEGEAVNGRPRVLGIDLESGIELMHDPLLYEDARRMVEYVAQALKQTFREATISCQTSPRPAKGSNCHATSSFFLMTSSRERAQSCGLLRSQTRKNRYAMRGTGFEPANSCETGS